MGFGSVNNEGRNLANLLRQNALAGGLALLCLLLALAGPDLTRALRFDWSLIQSGEWWRFVSGHLVHLGWSHTLMNVAALLLMSILFGSQLSNWRWAMLLLLAACGVSIGLVWFGPHLDWYVGLSGVLHGMFAAGIVTAWARRPGESLILGLGLAAKLVYEFTQGALPGSETTAGGPVIVEAHLYGAIAGLIIAVALLLSSRYRSATRSEVSRL